MISVGNQALKHKEYNVYIDESGDEGIGRGSKYFILTALVVDKDKDLEISKSVDLIKENLEMKNNTQLHWNGLKGIPNKRMILDTISNLDIVIINVIVDTYNVKFLPSNDIYHFFSGYLYERIAWLMNEKKAIANIFISSRTNLSTTRLLEYLNDKNNDKFNVDTSRIKNIKIVPNQNMKLLQLSDSCCSVLFQSLTKNNETYYDLLKIIKNKFYCRKGNVTSYGLKVVPNATGLVEYNNLLNYIK